MLIVNELLHVPVTPDNNPNIDGAVISLQYDVSTDTQFVDRATFKVDNTWFLEETAKQAEMVGGL